MSLSAKRVPELDGIRGIAILLVLVFHYAREFPLQHGRAALLRTATGLGWCGVELFFVLSGFLITGILLDTKGECGYFQRFYRRRALRILPLYFVVLALSFFVLEKSPPPFSEQLWYWLNLSNWRTAFHPMVYPNVTIYWSLAIEEQFYLIWPWVVLTCSSRRLLWICLFLILGCAALRNLSVFQSLNAEYSSFLYRLTPFRIDALAFGAVGALLVRDKHALTRVRRYLAPAAALGVAVLVAVVAAAGDTSAASAPMTRYGYSAFGLLFGSAVLIGHVRSGTPGTVILRNPLLVRCGTYSYCMYLIQTWVPALSIHLQGFGAVAIGLMILLRIAGCFGIAAISWHFFESRLLKRG